MWKTAKNQENQEKKVARAKIARAKERTDRHTNTQIKRLIDSIIYSKVTQHVHFVKFSPNLDKTVFHVDKNWYILYLSSKNMLFLPKFETVLAVKY